MQSPDHPIIPAPGSGAPPPAEASLTRLLATIVIACLNNAPLAAARLVLPIIALNMGAGTLFVGVMASLFTVAPMLLSVRFGRWVDRRGTLVPFAFASALILLATGIYFLAPYPPILLLVAGLIGSGAVFSHVAATRAVAGLATFHERTRNIGYLVVVYSLFQFLGPMLAGASLDHSGNTAAILVIGGFTALSGLLLLTGHHRFTRDTGPKPQRGSDNSAMALFRRPALRNKIIVSGTVASAMTVYPLIVSLHSVAVGIAPSKAGLMLGAFALGSLVSRACIPLATRLFPPRPILFATIISGSLLFAVLPAFHTVAPLIALSTCLGLALGMGVPIALSLIYSAAPEGRTNEAVGLNMSVTNFLQAATPLALAFVAQGAGIGPMVWTLGAAMVCVALMALLPRRRHG